MRPSSAVAVLAAAGSLVAVAPAPASTPAPTRAPLSSADPFAVPRPVAPVRDIVFERTSAAAARETATSSARRYPVHDGRGRRVTIGVASSCNPASCDAANPRKIADFLGSIVHGSEMNRLRVQLVTDAEMASVCGTGALACYFSEEDQMFLSGSDDTSTDGATRDFVLTHEYGHHLANHRRNPPFQPTIDWGTKRWVTFERVCQGVRAGALFPGDEGPHYFDNPGEAFAEAFAFNRFPNLVGWQWTSALRPSRRSFAAIRQDALHPWKHRTRLTETGSLGANGAQRAVEHLATPLDGIISLRLKAPAGADFDLTLRNRGGRVLRSAGGPGSRKVINYPLCGQARVKASVTRAGGGGRFRLIVNRP